VSGSSPTLVKLDRVFCSVDWEDIFLNCLLQSAATEDSDHCPLILGLVDGHPGKKRFQFECFIASGRNFRASMRWFKVLGARCSLRGAPWRLSLSRSKVPQKGYRVGVIEKLGISDDNWTELEK
jgi:hypothetical protein